MAPKKKKGKKKCCEKYLKSGKHCKNCPLLKPREVKGDSDKAGKKKQEKKKKSRKEQKKK